MSRSGTAPRLSSRSGRSIRGEAVAPGDKSISHRALILGAMAEGETQISGLLESEDVLRTAGAVQAFGASVTRENAGNWTIGGTEWSSPAAPIDCGIRTGQS